MSKKLLEVLPSLQSFKDNVISQLTNMFNGAEWLNDATSYTKQETIYRLLVLKYGDRVIRYDDANIFLNRLVFDLADLMPDIYAKQQVFIRNQLSDYLSSVKNRAIVIDSETTNNRNSDSNSKLGNSSSPLNLVIDSAEQIQQAPITSSNLSNVKLVENYNGNNQQVNYNFVNDLVKTLNADYSLRLNEFMELLGKHFVNIVGNYYRPQQCNNQTIKNEPYRFNNGYYVNEVDYLGGSNKQAIDGFNEKLERLSDQVATKQNQLIAGDNITIKNNVISANVSNVDLSNYYNKKEIDTLQEIQDRFITANSENIVSVNNKVNNNVNEIEEIKTNIASFIKFYKGQVIFFNIKQDFIDNLQTPLQLVEGVDYEVLEYNNYLMLGDNGISGGSNYIEERNLPYKEWGFDICDHWGKYGSYNYMLQPSNYKNITIFTQTQSASGDISYNGGSSIERRQFRWEYGKYGKDYPIEFLPKYKTIYGIKFLKNIK